MSDAQELNGDHSVSVVGLHHDEGGWGVAIFNEWGVMKCGVPPANLWPPAEPEVDTPVVVEEG